MYIELVKKYI